MNSQQVGDAEVGGAGRAVDRAEGDQPAAGGEHDELPEARQQVLRRAAEQARAAAAARPRAPISGITRIATPPALISCSACRGSRAAQHERAEHEPRPRGRAAGSGTGPASRRRRSTSAAASTANASASAAISSDTAERRVNAAAPAAPASSSDVQVIAPGGRLPTRACRRPRGSRRRARRRAAAARSTSSSSPVTSSTDWYGGRRGRPRWAPAGRARGSARRRRRRSAGGRRRRQLVAEPQLLEHDADREHDGAGRDQRAAVRRRAQELS